MAYTSAPGQGLPLFPRGSDNGDDSDEGEDDEDDDELANSEDDLDGDPE
jgi:hypothetical protein